MKPRTPGAQVADVGGAYVAVMGILAALLKRERGGPGDYIDVALSEAAMPLGDGGMGGGEVAGNGRRIHQPARGECLLSRVLDSR